VAVFRSRGWLIYVAMMRVPEHSRVKADGGSPLLEVRGIVKMFGSFTANDAIDFDLKPGEIHALLGENGAGKSTLVKMLYGLLQPTSGTILWQGAPVRFTDVRAARAAGIGMVFQHFSLFEALTAAENVALALDANEAVASAAAADVAQRLRELSQAYGLPIDPDREVWRLSVGERQRIEIVRALMRDPKLLILDEPTSVLTPQEAENLFGTLERIRGEGRSILYISHKLEEVRRLCDRATILRHGKVVATCDPRQETAASLARMMVGSDVGKTRQGGPGIVGAGPESPVRFAVKGLSLGSDDPHGVSLREVELEVRAGEIVGIAGVAGNGQDELFAALSGERLAPQAGVVSIDGADVSRDGINARRRRGAAFVPEERLGHGTAPGFSLSQNALVSGHATNGFARHGLVDLAAARRFVERVVRDFDIRKSGPDPAAGTLSGGNLQKFMIGRELLREPAVLVVAQPTWGVDAGAARLIRQALIDRAAAGGAVVVISQDLDELFEISDRIGVLFHGRLSPPQDSIALTREAAGLLMGGAAATVAAGKAA
jgi:general nucleoside transport system ATP-binding protein